MELPQFFKSVGQYLNRKKYEGIIDGGLSYTPTKLGRNDVLSVLDMSLYVNKAIAKRASLVGEIKFELHDSRGKKIEKDPILDLLYKPNDLFTGREFWKLYQTYYDLVGEVYIFLEGEREIFEARKVKQMHLLNPIAVTPKFTEDGKIDKYEYRAAGSKTIEYLPNQIIYIRNPDPKFPLRGQSLLRAGINAISTETQISTYHAKILENGGKVEGVFKFKTGNLTEKQLNDLKAQYNKEYAKARRSGMPLFLGGDSEYIKTGLNPNEMAFLEAKKATLEDICILTDVPRSMLANTSDTKFDNADAERATFLRETIVPLLSTLTVALDTSLVPDERTLTFVDPTPENVDNTIKKIKAGMEGHYMKINEARAMQGLDPVEGGDEIMVPFNLVPLGTESQSQSKMKMKDASSAEFEHPLRDADVREMYWKIMIKRMDAGEKLFVKALDSYFDGQAKRLTDMLAPTKTRNYKKKDLDELMSLELEVKIGKEKFTPILMDLLKQAGVDAMELVGATYAFNLTAGIESWMDKRVDLFVREINETSFKKLRSAFKDSLEAEEGRDGLINRIEDVYEGFKGKRAPTIARTEVHNATQFGTLEGYKQAGLRTKIWVAVKDSHTRDSHLSVDGEEQPMDRPFSNGLMFPGDPAGSAEEVINCRCVI